MTHVSTFSGIGGIDVAANWAGFQTVALCEIDKFCQRVLAKNFPGVPIYDDITTFTGSNYRGATLLSGGFPCQDISNANRAAVGIAGRRSGLVKHIIRLATEIVPSWILLENSPRLLTRGYDWLESELRNIGYSPVSVVLEAGDVGSYQESERVFIIASLDKMGSRKVMESPISNDLPRNIGRGAEKTKPGRQHVILRADSNTCETVYSDGSIISAPVFCGDVHGIPDRLDRLRALGNAVNPYQAYPILKVIADVEAANPTQEEAG